MPKIQDYLEAGSDATKRTRRVLLTMVVASTLTAAAVLNSLPTSWKQARLNQFKYSGSDEYITDLIGEKPHPCSAKAPLEELKACEEKLKAYQDRYAQLFGAEVRSYAETNSVHVPFFGINFDINDLGIVSGLALVIILIWFRLCVRTEIENLNLAFVASKRLNRVRDLYDLLAMRQVMINPLVPGRVRDFFYWFVPMFFCSMPALSFGAVVGTDFSTAAIGFSLNRLQTTMVLSFDVFWMGVITWLTVQNFRRWLRLDHAWTWYWCEYLIVSDSTHHRVPDQVGPSGLLKQTEASLDDALKKLQGKKLEESVLTQLHEGAAETDKTYTTYTYEYTKESLTIVIELKTDKHGKLLSGKLKPKAFGAGAGD